MIIVIPSLPSRVNGMAPIAQSAEGVSWVLMVVGPLMAGAGGLDLGRDNKTRYH